MTVHRTTPLPERTSRGRLIVAESVLPVTRAALEASSGEDGRHEGLVLWLGRTISRDRQLVATLVMSVATPPTKATDGSVFVDEDAVGDASRAARAVGLGVVAQVHSHPGHDTRHSDGDDRLIVMPFDGMFSLVVADFGRGSLLTTDGAGLHQYQDSAWVRVANDDAMLLVPTHVSIGS